MKLALSAAVLALAAIVYAVCRISVTAAIIIGAIFVIAVAQAVAKAGRS